jgi:hypothetical protein
MLQFMWTKHLWPPTFAGEAPAKVRKIENPAAPLRFCDHTSFRGQLEDSSRADKNVQTDAPKVPVSHSKPGRVKQGEQHLLDMYLERTPGSEQEAAATGSAGFEQEAAAPGSAVIEQEAAAPGSAGFEQEAAAVDSAGFEQEAAAAGSAGFEQEAAATGSAVIEQEAASAAQQASVAEQQTASIE